MSDGRELIVIVFEVTAERVEKRVMGRQETPGRVRWRVAYSTNRSHPLLRLTAFGSLQVDCQGPFFNCYADCICFCTRDDQHGSTKQAFPVQVQGHGLLGWSFPCRLGCHKAARHSLRPDVVSRYHGLATAFLGLALAGNANAELVTDDYRDFTQHYVCSDLLRPDH